MDLIEELKLKGVVTLNKHFVYISGKHGDGYIDIDWVFPDTELMRRICEVITKPYSSDRIDTVAAPAVGGVALVSDVCAYLNTRGKFPARVWADKVGDGFSFKRAGFASQLKDKRVLVVEDLMTTGGTVGKVSREVEACGGIVIGAAVICTRGGIETGPDFPWRLESASHADFSAYDPESCPLCAGHLPIVTDVGHGGKYQQEHPDYVGGWEKLLAA